tara:strand:+ start:89 stop:385 length:297 start_codon:yes stop_codon:yes gene_type:complete
MDSKVNRTDNKILMRLQFLSEKISDLIHQGKLEEVIQLDEERKKIINSFNNKHQNGTIDILKSILSKNKSDIIYLEQEKDKLTKKHNLSIKTFQAYSK